MLLLDEPASALALGPTNSVTAMAHDLVRERGVIAVAVVYDMALAAGFANRLSVSPSSLKAALPRGCYGS